MTSVKYKGFAVAKGKGSTFGGPNDKFGINEMAEKDSLSGIQGSLKMSELNPNGNYVALRFNYDQMSQAKLKTACVIIINPRNGKTVGTTPVDWGPNQRTGKSIDMSPGAEKALGGNATGAEFLFYMSHSPCSTASNIKLGAVGGGI